MPQKNIYKNLLSLVFTEFYLICGDFILVFTVFQQKLPITQITNEERNVIFENYKIEYIDKNNFKRLKVFEVAGSNHYKISELLKENDILNLIYEQDNKYDSKAIGIYSSYGKIGHISSYDLDYAHDLLSKGCNKAHVNSVKVYEYENYPNKFFVKICVPFPYKSK